MWVDHTALFPHALLKYQQRLSQSAQKMYGQLWYWTAQHNTRGTASVETRLVVCMPYTRDLTVNKLTIWHKQWGHVICEYASSYPHPATRLNCNTEGTESDNFGNAQPSQKSTSSSKFYAPDTVTKSNPPPTCEPTCTSPLLDAIRWCMWNETHSCM